MTQQGARKPVCQRAKHRILALIEADGWQDHPVVPSERDLATRFGVSRGTIRQALAELVHEGRLLRVPGRGTIVAPSEPKPAGNGDGRQWLVVAPCLFYYYPELLDVIEAEAARRGATLMVRSSRNDPQAERKMIIDGVDHGVEGVLLAPADGQQNGLSYDYLAELGAPVVVIDHWPTRQNPASVDSVISDNFAGAYQATVHLIRQGRRKIRIIAPSEGFYPAHDRRAGYETALADHGLTVPEGPGVTVDEVESEDPSSIRRCLDDTDAFVATNDNTAGFLMNHLHDLGACVPQDVAVIGYDDEPSCLMLRPTMSSVHVDKKTIGRRAVELLCDRIASGAQDRIRSLVVQPTLAVRRSTDHRGSSGRAARGTSPTRRNTESTGVS